MLNLRVICVGKLKEKFYKEACDEYVKRMKSLCQLEIIELKEESGDHKLEKEAEAIMSAIPPGSAVWALEIEGKLLSSEELAEKIAETTVMGASRIVLLIGSSEGLADKVKKMASFGLSMSRMTFPHHLARVMLLEQLYRAMMINEGRKYHK